MPYICLFPQINPDYKVWPAFLQFMYSTLHNISFSNPWLISGSSMIYRMLKIIDATLKKPNNLEIYILKNEP